MYWEEISGCRHCQPGWDGSVFESVLQLGPRLFDVALGPIDASLGAQPGVPGGAAVELLDGLTVSTGIRRPGASSVCPVVLIGCRPRDQRSSSGLLRRRLAPRSEFTGEPVVAPTCCGCSSRLSRSRLINAVSRWDLSSSRRASRPRPAVRRAPASRTLRPSSATAPTRIPKRNKVPVDPVT